jgi:hypothetical protein
MRIDPVRQGLSARASGEFIATLLEQTMPMIRANGTALYYEDTGGPGSPVVFSHGLLWNTGLFAPQIAVLKDRYRCIYRHGLAVSAVELRNARQCASRALLSSFTLRGQRNTLTWRPYGQSLLIIYIANLKIYIVSC